MVLFSESQPHSTWIFVLRISPKAILQAFGQEAQGHKKENCRPFWNMQRCWNDFISIMATWCCMIVGTFHASHWPWQIQLTCWGTRGTRWHFSKCGLDGGCALTSWGPYCNPDNDITQAIRREVQGTWQIEQPHWTFQFSIITWNPKPFQELRGLHVLKSFLGIVWTTKTTTRRRRREGQKRFSCNPCVVYVLVFLSRVWCVSSFMLQTFDRPTFPWNAIRRCTLARP